MSVCILSIFKRNFGEGQKKANRKYNVKTYDQVSFRFPEDKKADILSCRHSLRKSNKRIFICSMICLLVISVSLLINFVGRSEGEFYKDLFLEMHQEYRESIENQLEMIKEEELIAKVLEEVSTLSSFKSKKKQEKDHVRFLGCWVPHFGDIHNDFQPDTNLMGIDSRIADEDDKIYMSMSLDNMWAIDPSIPQEWIFENSTVVKLRIISQDNVSGFLNFVNFSDIAPYRKVEVKILDSFYGDKLSGEMTIYLQGGKILLKDFIEQDPLDRAEKMGLYNLSEEERNTLFINYGSDYDFEIQDNQEYIMILGNFDGFYTNTGRGFCIFQENLKDEDIKLIDLFPPLKVETENKVIFEGYRNVLTGNELILVT